MGSSRRVFEGVALFVISTMFVVPASGIDCYQCVGTGNDHPFQCNEYLSSDIDMEPTSCDRIYGAKFCTKTVGRLEEGVSVKRACSAANLGNYCEDVGQVGDRREYRTCVYTCDSDGCNPASTPKPNFMTSIVATFIPCFLLSSRR